ncbi:hypothetical protein JEY40_26635 [Bradyrhizobium japonicum]|uniref:hypothetical protein n=1 Tax=Bradyrhizobium japonicum TaxID=375 RepID=UPI00200C6C81|nr:hypothetical protein [Bradyrhizobium japonicum]UQD69581.1 hypothetical protein JEY40_26635 [Bradyrhizobium japonicum]
MVQKMENPAGGRGVPVKVQADGSNNPEYALAQRRKQYLAEIFALPAETACTIAELAFGEARS